MKKKPTPEEIAAQYKDESLAPAREVLEHVHKAVLGTPEFTLADGTKARVADYYEPQLSDDGELSCGFDVLLDNGTQLEFTLANTGWGKSFVAAIAPKTPKPGRHR